MKAREINEVKKKDTLEWPKVAIIILNWNGWKDTIECLESVFRNTYPNYQVIVIDNGSTNSSIEKIKAWAEGKQKVLTPEATHPLYHLSHPPIKKPIPYIYYNREDAEKGGSFQKEHILIKKWKIEKNNKSLFNNTTTYHPLILIQTGENLGFAGGNNIGIRYLLKKGYFNYIWLLNNDTVIDKDALAEMVKLEKSNKNVGMVGSKILYYDKPNIIQALGGTEKITWKTAGKHICDFKKDQLKFNNDFEIKGYIYGTSLLVREEVVKIVGIFDENYFMLMEETDWCFRVLKKGWKLFCCGKSKIWHKVSSSTKKGEEKSIFGRKSERSSLNNFTIKGYYSTRNYLYFTKKHFNKCITLSCIYLFLNIFKQFIGIILYDDYKFYRMKILLNAFYDGIKGKVGKNIELYKNK